MTIFRTAFIVPKLRKSNARAAERTSSTRLIIQALRLLTPAIIVMAALSLSPKLYAQSLTTLHTFSGPDGANPESALIQGPDGNFYGLADEGGANNVGAFFKISPTGSYTLLHSFVGPTELIIGAGLVLGTDGNFYGTTFLGGDNNAGSVFKITPTGDLTTLHSFVGPEGSFPVAGLIQGADGNFYGTTDQGGANQDGVVFRMTPDGVVTTLHSFDGTDGFLLFTNVIQGSDGDLYGVTFVGGSTDDGTIFRVTPTGGFTTLHTFEGSDGVQPFGALVQASDGNFYGTTHAGGTNGFGTIFRITPDGAFTTLHQFLGPEGAVPESALIQSIDGSLYGVTGAGGAADGSGFGTVIKVSLAGDVTVLYTFTDGADQEFPIGSLVQGTDGALYGTAMGFADEVDSTRLGTVFRLALAEPATHLVVSAPATTTAGSPFTYTVTALDAFNNVATGYTGTVRFTSSDGAATLPASGTLTNGSGTFTATLRTAGTQTLTATDTVTPAITGTATILVNAGPATHFAVSAPASATAGSPFNYTVTALDAFNNIAKSYGGSVHFTSSDGAASLPANSTLTNGSGTFTSTLRTAGSQTVTSTDTVTASITGTTSILVGAGPATHFLVSALAVAQSGTPFSVTVTAFDAFNNVATGYSGTVHFTSSDPGATLPANATLVNGTRTFSATLVNGGPRTITATDRVNPTVTGTATINVLGPAAFTTKVPVNTGFFTEDDVVLTTPAPITALTLTITVQQTPGLTFNGQYETVFGQFTQSHVTNAGTITYTYILQNGNTIPAGAFTFGAQMGSTGTAHNVHGDTFSATYTSSGHTFTVTGTF